MTPAAKLVEMQQSATALRTAAPSFDYPWEKMPIGGRPFNIIGSVTAPAFGAANQVVVCQFQAPSKFWAALKGLVLDYQGSNFVPGSGNIIWTVDIDVPLPAAGLVPSGYNMADYGQVQVPLGSFTTGEAWPVTSPGGEGAILFSDGDIVRIKVQTVAVVGTGPGNIVNGCLQGWIWPMGLNLGIGY